MLINRHEHFLHSRGEWCTAHGAVWWGWLEVWATLPAMPARQPWREQRPSLALAHACCRKGRSSSFQRYNYLAMRPGKIQQHARSCLLVSGYVIASQEEQLMVLIADLGTSVGTPESVSATHGACA